MTTVGVKNTQEVVVEHEHAARRRAAGDARRLNQVAPSAVVVPEVDFGECILLFGAFCNGKRRGRYRGCSGFFQNIRFLLLLYSRPYELRK